MLCQPPASILYGRLKKQIAFASTHVTYTYIHLTLHIKRTQARDTLLIYGA